MNEQAPSKELITAPENPTVEDLIAFYGDSNFRSGVTVRVPYRATRQALEDLQERVSDLLAQLAEKVIGDGSDVPQFFRNEDGDIDFGPVATHEPRVLTDQEWHAVYVASETPTVDVTARKLLRELLGRRHTPPPGAKFKVGDRVEWTNLLNNTFTGKVTEVRSEPRYIVQFDDRTVHQLAEGELRATSTKGSAP